MVKKINLVMFILLIIFTMTGCTSSIKNTQEEKQEESWHTPLHPHAIKSQRKRRIIKKVNKQWKRQTHHTNSKLVIFPITICCKNATENSD